MDPVVENQPDDATLLKEAEAALAALQEIAANPKWEKFADKPCVMMKMEVESRLASRG